jgi:GntR family transcriptional regulator, transcriptional repressor for pyruvate dehydrogenase complex
VNGDSSVPDIVGDGPVPRRIHEIVLWRIEEQIASGRLKVGDRLPSERDLAASLGVSRPVVREAIRALEAIGTVAQGTAGQDPGILVAAVPGDALTHLITLHVMLASFETADVVRVRIALERESARLAAKQATIADHTAMADDLAAMDDLGITPEDFNDRDTAFHVAIARASGNVLLTELTTAVPKAMRPTQLRALRADPDFPATAARLAVEHHGIHDAIVNGDGELAANRIEAHIDGFYSVLGVRSPVDRPPDSVPDDRTRDDVPDGDPGSPSCECQGLGRKG